MTDKWFWLFCIPLLVPIVGGVAVSQLTDKAEKTNNVGAASLAGPVIFSCNETHYDKTGNNPFAVPRYFTHYPGSKLVWDNYKDSPLTLHIAHETPAILVAEADTTEPMPRRDQINACIEKELSERPDLEDASGVNPFSALSCTTAADVDVTEVPVHLKIRINRVTGALTIQRTALSVPGARKVSTGGTVNDIENSGECAIAEKRL